MPAGKRNLVAALKARFPAEEAAIDSYFRAIEAHQTRGGARMRQLFHQN
eukprot:SAG11_NODE_1267_length_5342_cov_1.772459_2_plen_49_part_00